MTKPNKQHQFDLLCVHHDNVCEENTYRYKLTGVDTTSRFNVSGVLETNKASNVAFLLEAICKKSGVFRNPKVFSEYKKDVTRLLEKRNFDIHRKTTKYRHIQAAFLEAFNK